MRGVQAREKDCASSSLASPSPPSRLLFLRSRSPLSPLAASLPLPHHRPAPLSHGVACVPAYAATSAPAVTLILDRVRAGARAREHTLNRRAAAAAERRWHDVRELTSHTRTRGRVSARTNGCAIVNAHAPPQITSRVDGRTRAYARARARTYSDAVFRSRSC